MAIRKVRDRQLKLPRNYYKRRTPPPALRQPSRVFNANFHANFGSIGPGRNRAISTIRKTLLQDLATSIVNDMRTLHINVTSGNQPDVNNRVDGWKQIAAKGSLNQDVAVIVDGSPTRPIKNVSFGGQIVIMSPPSVELMIEAAEFAYNWMIAAAAKTQGPYSGDMVKKGKAGRPYRYKKSFKMFKSDDSVEVKHPADLRKSGAMGEDDWISILNYAPYAAFLERYRYPQGIFWQVWKRLRRKYGQRLAIRFDFVESTLSQHNMTSEKGVSVPVAQPVIRIGMPNAFATRRPNMRKIKRDASKRRRGI